MAEELAVDTKPSSTTGSGRDVTSKAVMALLAVLVVQAFFALCLVSALQLLAPRNMPFGVVGSSPLVAQAQETVGLDIVAYPSQSAAMDAVRFSAFR